MTNLTNVTVSTTPIFIPNLDEKRHVLACVVVTENFESHRMLMWGAGAEKAALTINKGTKVNLKGQFTTSTIGLILAVKQLELVNPVKVDVVPFDYQSAYLTGKFGNAKVVLRTQGGRP